MAKSTYHYYIQKFSLPDKYQEEKKMICQIFQENHGRYGYRRITLGLNQRGYNLNHKTVLKLMNQCDLKCMVRRKKYNTYRGTVGKVAPNILERDFSTTALNQKWVTDVSEFSLFGSKRYLSPIMDLYNREIISFTITESPNLSMVTDMLKKAFTLLPDDVDLIIHSDQGWHYQHPTYQQMLRKKGIVQSMSRKGNCLDNAVIENFFGLLKSELLYLREFENMEQFVHELNEYIYYYNNYRIKTGLGGLSPIQLELNPLILFINRPTFWVHFTSGEDDFPENRLRHDLALPVRGRATFACGMESAVSHLFFHLVRASFFASPVQL